MLCKGIQIYSYQLSEMLVYEAFRKHCGVHPTQVSEIPVDGVPSEKTGRKHSTPFVRPQSKTDGYSKNNGATGKGPETGPSTRETGEG
jgi:hypothetical protein